MPPDFRRAAPTLAAAAKGPLARGAGEFSGPGCLVRHLISSVAPSVLRSLAYALRPCQRLRPSCVLVGLHVRRGDSAMHRECKTCVDQSDPDVKGGDRIETERAAAMIGYVNRSLHGLEAALGRHVYVFMASDTEWAVRTARAVVGREKVLTVSGRPVHSTQVASKAREAAGIKIAADFLGLALSDMLLAIGQSAFSGNAAAMSLAPSRVGDNALMAQMPEMPWPEQIEAVKRTLVAGGG
mmetsp:Transcript_15780/g.47448  ORF Transcript_15780/g.47448 Transcript_15780/m.47448 type:complete len:240 (+) Transcript_15780:2-721(+)